MKKNNLMIAIAILIISLAMPVKVCADTKTGQPDTKPAKNVGITFSTDYPGVTVKPGQSTVFPLYITNTSSIEATATLESQNLPSGWEGRFKGTTNEISMIHVGSYQKKENSPSLTFSLNVPDDAKEDTYKITLRAAGENVNEELVLSVRVDADEKKIGAGNFTTDYSQQEGAVGTKFSYSTKLTNNSSENQTYSLSAEDAPEGWSVTFMPSEANTATSSVPVDAGTSSTIKVSVIPAQNVTAGEYNIKLLASSSDETLELPVTIKITGTYGLEATTSTSNLYVKAYAGETKDVTLSIRNTGNIDLTAVNLKGQASTDWTVTFDQDTIDVLPAGGVMELSAHITPAKDAIIGDYVTYIKASNAAVSSDCALRVSVQNHTGWGVAALVIIAALILGLVMVIRKFGRR